MNTLAKRANLIIVSHIISVVVGLTMSLIIILLFMDDPNFILASFILAIAALPIIFGLYGIISFLITPKILLSYDYNYIYIHKRIKEDQRISFSDIVTIYGRSITHGNFRHNTSEFSPNGKLVIETKNKKFQIRNMANIKGVRMEIETLQKDYMERRGLY